MSGIRVGLLAVVLSVVPGLAGAGEPIAVVTELSPGTGDVRVRRSGDAAWVVAEPLLALREGDLVRTSGSARAVLVFAGGGIETVSAANSPLTVQAPARRSGTQTLQNLVGGAVRFLSGQRRQVDYAALSVRGAPIGPPRIVSPRDTRLLPGALAFEWVGPASLRYAVRLSDREGSVWEETGVAGLRVAYPSTAPPLRAGAHYEWVLAAPGQPSQKAEFEVLPADHANRIWTKLAEVTTATSGPYPRATVAVLRATLLIQERLYADARGELLAALVADPGASTLHQLLGHVYEQIGLAELAAAEYETARTLSQPKS